MGAKTGEPPIWLTCQQSDILVLMAVPKRKMSRSNTRHRRSAWKATAPDLVPITVNGREIKVPRPLVRAYQRGLIDS
ncbi:MAG: rpmF [Nocardioidaceae bacterium]|nr:rpmF [Nocardioidaceae bacterium]